MSSKLAFPIQTIHKSDRTLLHLESHCLGPNHHLHLEAVTLALRAANNLLQHVRLVQSETAGQIANSRHQHNVGDQVRSTRRELPKQVPAVYSTLNVSTAGIPGSGHDIGVGLLLNPDHLGYELGVVAEVGVHYYDEVARHEF